MKGVREGCSGGAGRQGGGRPGAGTAGSKALRRGTAWLVEERRGDLLGCLAEVQGQKDLYGEGRTGGGQGEAGLLLGHGEDADFEVSFKQSDGCRHVPKLPGLLCEEPTIGWTRGVDWVDTGSRWELGAWRGLGSDEGGLALAG